MRTAAAHTYATAAAQRARVTLGDGTRVTLAPQTTLRVEPGFGGNARLVVLRGEAYFDVANASGAPFVVRSGGVSARVLGTAFDVKHYPGDATVQVAVVSGRVAAGGARSAVLVKGAVARLTDSSTVVAPDGDAEAHAGWTAGRLVFVEAPVSEVLATLGRWYAVEFRLADSSLAGHVVTAQLDYRSRADMLTALQLLLEVRARVDGNVVTLLPAVRRLAPKPRGAADHSFSTAREVGR